MSVVKDRYVERFVERIENTVVHVVDHMDLNSLQQYAIQQMSDYYVNVAPDEEVDEFLKENEELPF